MCYMAHTRRIGVRELRQNLSVHLRRVIAGETFEVTERGRTVAVLSPLHESATPLERLKAQGRITAATVNLLDLGLPPNRRINARLSKALTKVRDDRL